MGTEQTHKRSLELANQLVAELSTDALKALYDKHEAFSNSGLSYEEYLKLMGMSEEDLMFIAQHADDKAANKAMKELRKLFDKTYGWCEDCDGLVVKEKDCCLNSVVKNNGKDKRPS